MTAASVLLKATWLATGLAVLLLFAACRHDTPHANPQDKRGEKAPSTAAATAEPPALESGGEVKPAPIPTIFPSGADRDANAFLGDRPLAIARVTEHEDECTGAGGSHIRLEVVDLLRGKDVAVHVTHLYIGGHAWYPSHRMLPGDLFVVAFQPIPPGGEAVTRFTGQCVVLGPAQGMATALLSVESIEHGKRTFGSLTD